MKRDNERLRDEKQVLIENREERAELVRYVEKERSITERRAQAGIATRLKW